MRLVEQHIISKGDTRWHEFDRVCWYSKNVYNAAMYRIRQHYFQTKQYLNYYAVEKQFKKADLLPDQDFTGMPRIPKYKDTQSGRNIIYTLLNIRKPMLKQGIIKLTRLAIEIKIKITNYKSIQQVQIVPKSDYYLVEVVYHAPETQADVDKDKIFRTSYKSRIAG